ncbi:ABC transporter permease [Mechercharimyces sp. CAU 1602]|nr:ABC transporter permease [Mechercharimyces sp. CAU 1602]
MIVIYADNIVSERKHDFILYTRTRIWLPSYIWSKIIVNALMSFVLSFLLVFLPFLFVFYIEPHLSFVTYSPVGTNTLSATTFDQLLSYGTFIYGVTYASWVAVNGVVYATLTMLLVLAIRNPLLSLALPFLWYHISNFVFAILKIEIYSPLFTIFPFGIEQQELWTILIPYSILCLFIGITALYLYKKPYEWMN